MGHSVRNLQHIEPNEEAEARRLIDQQFIDLTGKPFQAKTCGYFVTMKIYTRPEDIRTGKRADGSEYKIWLPGKALQQDKYQSCTALVIDMGPQAYKGKHPDGSDKFPEGPWCRIGDWVAIPRYECHLFMYRNVPLGMLPDDRILQVINDPTDVEPVNLKDEF